MNYLIEPRRRTATIPTCSARGDASQIAMAHGYQPLYIQSAAGKGISQKILNNIARMGDALQLARKVSSRDTVFMQWPTSMGRVFPLFLHWLRKTRPHLVVLVHDIDILRGMGGG